MPAPTPIQIRYGPAGLLAQAASLVGQGDNYAAQHAEDMQFINNRLANADRIQQQILAEQAVHPNQLQQAYAQRHPAPDYYNAAQSPIDQSALLKNAYLQSASADIPDEEKANLAALVSARGVSPDQFRLAVSDAAKRNSRVVDDAAEAEAKKNYIQSILSNIPQEYQPGLVNLAQDKKTTASQLRTAGDAIIQRVTAAGRAQTSQQVQGVDNEIRRVRSDMVRMAAELAKNGIDVNSATPASLNPTSTPAGAPDFLRNAAHGLSLGMYTPNDVTPGSVDQRPAYIAYQKMRQRLNELTSQRHSITGGRSSAGFFSPDNSANVSMGQATQPVPVSSPEEAAQLPPGTAFVTPDGEVRVRH